MRSETTYYAFDETEFKSEDECKEYERQIQESMNSVVFLNPYKEIVSLDILDSQSCNSFNPGYIYIRDASTCHSAFEFIESYLGIDMPHCEFDDDEVIGWDGFLNDWVNIVKRCNQDRQDLVDVSAVVSKHLF